MRVAKRKYFSELKKYRIGFRISFIQPLRKGLLFKTIVVCDETSLSRQAYNELWAEKMVEDFWSDV